MLDILEDIISVLEIVVSLFSESPPKRSKVIAVLAVVVIICLAVVVLSVSGAR